MEGMIPDVEEYMKNLRETLERASGPRTDAGTIRYMKMLNLQRSALPMRDIIACNLGLTFNEMSRTSLEKRLVPRPGRGVEPLRGRDSGFVIATLPTYRDRVEDL